MKSLLYAAVYNQVDEFPAILEELKKKLPCDEILLVDDASTDGSQELVKKSGFKYIIHDQNKGVGGTIATALDFALENEFELIGTIAANGKMLPSELERVYNPILKNEADYVTGSRFLQGGDSPNLPTFRKCAIPAVNQMVKIITGANLTDATCGYRAYKLDIIKKLKFDWHAKWMQTYSLEYYLYAKIILNKKIRWTEVPITMRYPKRKNNYSKIRPVIGWWEMLRPWIIAKTDGKKIDWD